MMRTLDDLKNEAMLKAHVKILEASLCASLDTGTSISKQDIGIVHRRFDEFRKLVGWK